MQRIRQRLWLWCVIFPVGVSLPSIVGSNGSFVLALTRAPPNLVNWIYEQCSQQAVLIVMFWCPVQLLGFPAQLLGLLLGPYLLIRYLVDKEDISKDIETVLVSKPLITCNIFCCICKLKFLSAQQHKRASCCHLSATLLLWCYSGCSCKFLWECALCCLQLPGHHLSVCICAATSWEFSMHLCFPTFSFSSWFGESAVFCDLEENEVFLCNFW